MAISAPLGDGGNGDVYVVFGQEGGFGTSIDLTNLDATQGFEIKGVAGDYAGVSLSVVDDLRGDGFSSLVIGAPYSNGSAGTTYVVFGHEGSFGTDDGFGHNVLDLATLAPTDGFEIQGGNPGDLGGWSVSSAGDVNGDGYADLIIGADQKPDRRLRTRLRPLRPCRWFRHGGGRP